MAGPVGSSHGSPRQRVFVLVDEDAAKGVFFTWEAAEAFADENRYSLDKLMEYETRSDYPDHLHLMAALWEDDLWIFQGSWSRKRPDWKTPPKKVRLDHYHARGSSFHLLRQREFDWEDGLLEQIHPMAPDSALRVEPASAAPVEKPQWKPSLSTIKPLRLPPEESGQKPSPVDAAPAAGEPTETAAVQPGPEQPSIENQERACTYSLFFSNPGGR